MGPNHGPEEAVHHRSQARKPPLFGEFNGCIDCCRGRDALHQEHLIQPHMQQPTKLWWLLLRGHLAKTVKPSIQNTTLTNRPIGQFRGQATIRSPQWMIPKTALKSHIRIGPRGNRLQHVPRQLAWRNSDGQRRGQDLGVNATKRASGRQRNRRNGTRPSPSTGIPSIIRSCLCIQSLPSRLRLIEILPLAFTTRCQGTFVGNSSRRRAQPTCRAHPQAPIRSAICP